MASTSKNPLLSLGECERDGNMLKATLLFSLTHLAYMATYLFTLAEGVDFSQKFATQ